MNTITIAFLLSLLANIHLVHAMEMGNKKKSMALQQVSALISSRKNRILDIQHAKKDDNNVQYKDYTQ